MPFISRLKKLGTLSVPQLQTTLTVYLINLEHSEETNLVYTSSNPIPSDVAPPPDLRFECPEGHTKRGDVLIWASRVHKKACYVHACWVFDGSGWAKPNSDSEIMMDHPVHPDYQLVILSGPYVKWELKPDPDREPSLGVPDPPPVRPGARGSMNTIVPASSLLPPQRVAEHPEPPVRHVYTRPRSSGTVSDTPDGSAAMCSSSRFSTPLSDLPEDKKPEIGESEHRLPTVATLDRSPGPSGPSRLPPPPQITQLRSARLRHPESSSKPEVPASVQRSLRSVSTEGTSLARTGRERPKGARSLPSARQTIPVTAAPLTPDSPMRARTRRQIQSYTEGILQSSPSSRRRKRLRPVDDDDFILLGSLTPTSAPRPSTLPPAKRRRLSQGPKRKVMLKLPVLARDRMDLAEFSQDDTDSDSLGDTDSIWDKLEELQKEKDALATRVGEASDLAVSHAKLVRETRERDDLVEELRCQLASVTTSFEKRLAEEQDKTAHETLAHQNLKAEAGETQQRMRIIEDEFAQLRRERDSACRIADEARLEMVDLRKQRDAALLESEKSKRASNDIAIARASDVAVALRNIRQLEAQKKELEADLAQTKGDFETQIAALRSENDKQRLPEHLHTGQQLEDITVQLEEEKRRAAGFESSLRVAQEMLLRQRDHAQEKEVMQRKTISQLARELQQYEKGSKELMKKNEGLERQNEELQKSLLAETNAHNTTRDAERRGKDEIERMKAATQADRCEISYLQATVAANRKEIIAAHDKSHTCQMLIDQMQHENKACDAALAEEIRIRTDLEAQLLEVQRSMAALEETINTAHESLTQERTAKHAAESKLEAQRILVRDHLSISDRERGRLEELLLERRSSLQLDLRCKTRDLESLQAECTRLKVERSTDREYFNTELDVFRDRIKETIKDCEMAVDVHRAESASATQALDNARVDFAASQSVLSIERDRLDQELSETRQGLENALSDSQSNLAECLQQRRRIEDELSALQLQFRSQTQDLESAKAECVQSKADTVSERQHLMAQLSSLENRFKEQLTASRDELAAVREEYKSTKKALQAQCASLELKTRHAAESLKDSQEEIAQLKTLLRIDRETLKAELSSSRENVSSLESLLAIAKRERSEVDGLLAEERLLREQTSSETASNVKALEDVRADLVKITADLAAARLLVQDADSREAILKQDLSCCQSALATAETGKREQEKLLAECQSITNDLELSRAECLRLEMELTSQREGFSNERSLSPDGLRSKLTSLEACLELEKTAAQALRKQLTMEKEQSSNYWSDLGSQLLRSLHEVQDQLKIEQIARQALQDELTSERLKNRVCEPLHNKV